MHKESFFKKISTFFQTHIILLTYILLGLLILITSGIFLFSNNLLGWDHSAHVYSAEFIKNNSWPNPVTWNPNYFNGYPQNNYYPPLFSFILATFSFVLPTLIAYKLFLILLYILTPLVAYLFSSIFTQDKKKQLILTLLLILLFFLPDTILSGNFNGIGGTILSTFYIGLGPNFLGLLLLLIFIYAFEKKKSTVLLGLIGTLGILSHYIFLLAGAYLLAKILTQSELKKIGIVITISLFLSAFWWIPAVLLENTPILSGVNMTLLNLSTVLLILGIIILGTKNNQSLQDPETLFFIIGGLILVLGFISVKLDLPISSFRLLLITAIFITPFIFSALYQKVHNHFLEPLVIASIIILIIVFSLFIPFSSIVEVTLSSPESTTAHALVLGDKGINTTNGSHHAIRNEYFKITNNKLTNFLFTEQAPESVFTMGLAKATNENELIWGVVSITDKQIDLNNNPAIFNYFNIDRIISTDPINPLIRYSERKQIGEIMTYTQTQVPFWQYYNKPFTKSPIYEYTLSHSDFVEIIKKYPSPFRGEIEDWRYFSAWWLGNNTDLLVKEKEFYCEVDQNATITNLTRTNTKITFTVDSQNNVPILIKESNFPNWHAYSDGKEIPIYTAAPNLMLIATHGNITLKYEQSQLEIITKIITILTLLTIITHTLLKHKKTKLIK